MVYLWAQTDNMLGRDMNLYSTYDDALNDEKAWTYCAFDEYPYGAFYNCGPKDEVLYQFYTRGSDAALTAPLLTEPITFSILA